PLFFLNDIGTSLVATAAVVWYLWRRRPPDGRRHWREPAPLAMVAVLVGSAVLSYAYAKSEIMSAAGVFYALVVYFAVRELAEVMITKTRPSFRVVVVLAIAFVSTAWAWRAMGLQYRLQRGAFEARSEWVLRLPPFSPPPIPPAEARLTPRLLDEALHR